MKAVYLAWIARHDMAVTGDGLPEKLTALRAFTVRGPRAAAEAMALCGPISQNPYSAEVAVVRASRINDWRPGIKRYFVEFSRGIKEIVEKTP